MSNVSDTFDTAIRGILVDDSLSDETKIRYVLECLKAVAKHGWEGVVAYSESNYFDHTIVKQAILQKQQEDSSQ
jgi:hypothetical protein